MTSSSAAIPSVSEGFIAYPIYLWNNAHEVIAKYDHVTDDHVQILVGDATVTLKIVPDAPKGAYGLETLSAPCLIEKEGELNLSDMDKQLLVLYQTIVAIMVA